MSFGSDRSSVYIEFIDFATDMNIWNYDGKDPSTYREAVETRLQEKEELLRKLMNNAKCCEKTTMEMVKIIDGFDERLSSLEETLLPIYQRTEKLTRCQENTDKTLVSMDKVIAFHNVSGQVEAIIKAGPQYNAMVLDVSTHRSTSLDSSNISRDNISIEEKMQISLTNYIHTMSRLKQALNYFEKNNPSSIELVNVKYLYNMGCDSLDRHFEELLRKNSVPKNNTDILSGLAEGSAVMNIVGGSKIGGDTPTAPPRMQMKSTLRLTNTPISTRTTGVNSNAHTASTKSSGSADVTDHSTVKSPSMSSVLTSKTSTSSTVTSFAFPDNVQMDLANIAEWLNANDHSKFMTIYANVRSQMLMKYVEQICESSSSGEDPVRDVKSTGGRRSVTLHMSGKSVQRRISGVVSSKVDQVMSAVSGVGSSNSPSSASRPSSTTTTTNEYLQITEKIETVCGRLSVLQKLMSVERRLMVGIIPFSYHRATFEAIIEESFNSTLTLASRTVKLVGNLINSSSESSSSLLETYKCCVCIFQLMSELLSSRSSFEQVFEIGGTFITSRSKFHNLIVEVENCSSHSLETLFKHVRCENSTKEKLPPNGTVFHVTSNALLIIEQLVDFIEPISYILAQDSNYNQRILRLPHKIPLTSRKDALLAIWIESVLIQLNETLALKSQSYSDPFLRAIFRLNNIQHIINVLIEKRVVLNILRLVSPTCMQSFNEIILEQKRLYSQSWNRLIQFIWADDIPSPMTSIGHDGSSLSLHGHKFSEKHCKMIKDRCVGFNKEMEEICQSQSKFDLPHPELRESIKRGNKEYILPKYVAFHDRYSCIQFAKSVEKYIKYTPTDVSVMLDSFFNNPS